jgi:hypothetical protein
VRVVFADKGVLRIAPHGKESVLVVVCSFTAGKDGRVKAKVTEIDGKDGLKQKVEEKLPVGTEFGFTWKVKGGTATLGDVTGDAAEPLKTHLEGDYDQKK